VTGRGEEKQTEIVSTFLIILANSLQILTKMQAISRHYLVVDQGFGLGEENQS
jgi:hypothetical protein